MLPSVCQDFLLDIYDQTGNPSSPDFLWGNAGLRPEPHADLLINLRFLKIILKDQAL